MKGGAIQFKFIHISIEEAKEKKKKKARETDEIKHRQYSRGMRSKSNSVRSRVVVRAQSRPCGLDFRFGINCHGQFRLGSPPQRQFECRVREEKKKERK